MSLREELDQFLTAHGGIDHLVYGDVSTGMVLYAGAVQTRAQEDHDRLLASGLQAFRDATMEVDAKDGIEIFISDADCNHLFVRGSSESEEGLFFELGDMGNAFTIADAASAMLAKFAAD